MIFQKKVISNQILLKGVREINILEDQCLKFIKHNNLLIQVLNKDRINLIKQLNNKIKMKHYF